MDALDWKGFYAEERRRLGDAGLDALLDAAPPVGPASAVVFPHTRLERSGALVAAAARWAVERGADRVLALGVLHGARRQDRDLVTRARAGEPAALRALRRIHGPGGHASEEFSLDGFAALLDRAARRAGKEPPELVARYPFLVGTRPEALPGLDELARLVEAGCAVVATTDPIHHGVGYGTEECRDPADPETVAWARAAIRDQLDALERRDWTTFATLCARHRSDLRDVGPALATLLGEARFSVGDVTLVDYGDVLGAPAPTWVAGALVTA